MVIQNSVVGGGSTTAVKGGVSREVYQMKIIMDVCQIRWKIHGDELHMEKNIGPHCIAVNMDVGSLNFTGKSRSR